MAIHTTLLLKYMGHVISKYTFTYSIISSTALHINTHVEYIITNIVVAVLLQYCCCLYYYYTFTPVVTTEQMVGQN